MLGDTPAAVSSQLTTLRATLVVGGVATSEAWYVYSLPRQFVNVLQTAGVAPASVRVDWAIRDSSTPGVPEWLHLQTFALVVGTPVNVLLGDTDCGGTGAVWLRFTITGAALDACELAAAAFV